jgi:hypothetical protein
MSELGGEPGAEQLDLVLPFDDGLVSLILGAADVRHAAADAVCHKLQMRVGPAQPACSRSCSLGSSTSSGMAITRSIKGSTSQNRTRSQVVRTAEEWMPRCSRPGPEQRRTANDISCFPMDGPCGNRGFGLRPERHLSGIGGAG